MQFQYNSDYPGLTAESVALGVDVVERRPRHVVLQLVRGRKLRTRRAPLLKNCQGIVSLSTCLVNLVSAHLFLIFAASEKQLICIHEISDTRRHSFIGRRFFACHLHVTL